MCDLTDTFCLAPLRGVTLRSYRNLLCRYFVAPQYALAPFIPTVAGAVVKPSLLKDVDPALEQGLPLVPQVIGKCPAQLRTMLAALRDLGYERADLNAGCPYPFIIKKGRGSGLLRTPATLESLLEVGCELMPQGFSLKVRLGIDSSTLLLERMEMINRYPLREVTIHARTARQMYEGSAQPQAFGETLAHCAHPVVYNGDIFTVEDYLRLKKRFPQVTTWMVGRGAARDPFLFGRLQGHPEASAKREILAGFLAAYLEATCAELSGPQSVLGRMKELWSYLHCSFSGGAELWRTLKVTRTLDEYRRVVEELWR